MSPILPKTPISVAIIGLGRAGWHLHLEVMLKHPGFRIVAVADPDESRTDEAVKLTGCRKFPSLAATLADCDASLIVLATPSSSHHAETLQVLRSGRHCILEKPMAMTTAEAMELVAESRQRGLHLLVNHSYLHRAEYHHLSKIIQSGVLGPLFHLRTFWGYYARRWDWQTLRKNGGGQINNTCTHVFSIILPLLGSPVCKVSSTVRNIKDSGDTEDHVHLMLETRSGVSADVLVSSAMALGLPRWMLCGRYGTMVGDGREVGDGKLSRLRYYDPTKVKPVPVIDAAAPGREYPKDNLPWQEMELPLDPKPVKSFHENVYDVLCGRAEPVITPESAVEVVRVIEMVHKASGV